MNIVLDEKVPAYGHFKIDTKSEYGDLIGKICRKGSKVFIELTTGGNIVTAHFLFTGDNTWQIEYDNTYTLDCNRTYEVREDFYQGYWQFVGTKKRAKATLHKEEMLSVCYADGELHILCNYDNTLFEDKSSSEFLCILINTIAQALVNQVTIDDELYSTLYGHVYTESYMQWCMDNRPDDMKDLDGDDLGYAMYQLWSETH